MAFFLEICVSARNEFGRQSSDRRECETEEIRQKFQEYNSQKEEKSLKVKNKQQTEQDRFAAGRTGSNVTVVLRPFFPTQIFTQMIFFE